MTAAMSPASRLSGSALLVAGLGVAALGMSLRAGAQSAPMEVITDTPAYCQHLSDQVSQKARAMEQPPPEVMRLSDEGERLCDEGQVRGGIMRLRRAWLLMLHPQGQQSAH
jgi:hypothetical protein